MEREILFRAKDKSANKWVYGYVSKFRNIRNEVYTGIIQICDQETNECSMSELCPVIPETVGQFTGLFDKNGKKIFEGDIVISRMSSLKYLVAWKDCQFEIKDNYGNIYVPKQEFLTHIELEVIGNIHDNPESD